MENENSVLKSALKKIAKDSKCKPQCTGAIIGPTGPQGPQGPVSVSVGTTTTGEPGSDASVINTGTSENVVLSFTIPQGPTGPQGSQGDIGPTGPANGLNAYGGLYNFGAGSVTLDSTNTSTVTLGTQMSSENVTYGTNTITLNEAGDYELIYSLEGTSGQTDSVTISVQSNESDIPGTAITKTLTASQPNSYYGDVIVFLNEGTTINLALTGGQSDTINLNGTGVNAKLIVKKLN